MNISRIILIILLFFVFFEIGLFSSYTLATGEVPDPGELINMQVSTVTSFFSPDNVGGLLIKDPDNINVTNRYELADKLSEVADVDGINVDNMTITTVDDTDKDEFNVTVTAFGYSKPKGKSGSIIINGEPDYKIIATATAEHNINGIEVKLDTKYLMLMTTAIPYWMNPIQAQNQVPAQNINQVQVPVALAPAQAIAVQVHPVPHQAHPIQDPVPHLMEALLQEDLQEVLVEVHHLVVALPLVVHLEVPLNLQASY